MNPIKERRIAAGMTRTRLAEMVQVCPASISSWERGTYRPKPTRLQRICDVLGCDPAWMIERLYGEEGGGNG